MVADGSPNPRVKSPSARRIKEPATEARRRVVHLAGELLDEFGYLAMTMDELTSRAGVSKKTVYRWWPDKATLIADVLVTRAVTHPVPDLGDTRAELHAVFAATQAYAEAGDAATMLFILEAVVDEAGVLRRTLDQMITPRRDAARAAVQRGIARGDLPADIDGDALLDLWNGLAAYRQSFRPAPLPTHTVDQLIALALAGHVPRLARGN